MQEDKPGIILTKEESVMVMSLADRMERIRREAETAIGEVGKSIDRLMDMFVKLYDLPDGEWQFVNRGDLIAIESIEENE